MHPPRLVDQQASVGRHRGAFAQDVLERGRARARRVRGLARMGELLRVAQKHEVARRACDREYVGQGHLAGLVHEQRVNAALELRPGPHPGRACRYVQVAVCEAD